MFRIRSFTCLIAVSIASSLPVAGCSGGGSGEFETTGSLSVALEINGGADIDAVEWEITGGDMEPMSGSIDTSAPGATASVEVFGLPPTTGDDYMITMAATTTDGKTACEGSADFGIDVGQVTAVMVVLNCKLPERFGGVRVNGKLNVCAELLKAVVSPLQTSVGNTIDLSATGQDAEGDAISYVWSATGGTLADSNAQETTFTCGQVGEQTITISVSEDDFEYCMDDWTVPVTCVPADSGDLCEGVTCNDDGNECTDEACNPANGMCETTNNTNACDGESGTCNAGECVPDTECPVNLPANPQSAVDLLFIVDDSPSMLQEQRKLAEQVPRLVNLLLTGGIDVDDSMPVGEFPAVESLHVGVITPDLGYSTAPPHGFSAGVDFNPTPACTANGKAGFLQVNGLIDDDDDPVTPRVLCSAQTPPAGARYLDRAVGADMSFDVLFLEDVECVTGQTGGCGFEQQLESILAQDRNSANSGFSRDDALLAVILITDEDDCSTTDPRLFDVDARPGNPFQGPFTTNDEVQFNLRCWRHSQALQAIDRYVTGIAALKDDPSQIVFAAITGIPEDSALDSENFPNEAERYDAILAHPGMQETPDPAFADAVGQQLRPACGAGSADGAAHPGRRIVEVARGLVVASNGVGTVVESICASDYAPALNAIVDRIAAGLQCSVGAP